MTLNDTEVQRQIRHMMAFIDQEAREKVEEIDAKAEEEFQIEKSRLVQNQRLKIMEYYAKKEKQIELTKKMWVHFSFSNFSIQSRFELEKSIQIKGFTEQRKSYRGICCFWLYFQSLLPGCIAAYRKETGSDCKVVIDNNYLPDSLAGGVELYNKDGRIKVVNTLESRLDQISERLMPKLREILFGVNEGRKFHN
ncbi:unnamed protein product [Trichobilharzia regenti]|nr:unnamed protein product [Trichobilharzia regenti]